MNLTPSEIDQICRLARDVMSRQMEDGTSEATSESYHNQHAAEARAARGMSNVPLTVIARWSMPVPRLPSLP